MLYLTAAAIFVLDRITKYVMMDFLQGGGSVKIFDFFHLTLVFNTGTAFGLLKGQNTFLTVLSAIAAVAIVFYSQMRSLKGILKPLALGLILGGACGNLIDRIRFGCVIDFLDFRIWPVFNVADSALTVGVALLVINFFFSKHNEQRTTSNEQRKRVY